MASKVLLVNSNQFDRPYPAFPLGLAHVDAALQQAGNATQWFGPQIDGHDPAGVLAAFQPGFIGISVRNIDDVQINRRQTFYESLTRCANGRLRIRPFLFLKGGNLETVMKNHERGRL